MTEEQQREAAWSLSGIWNEQLTFGRKEREPYKRDYIWASEMGKDPYDRWLTMNAVKPDFDFDERTLRKFAAGDFFERIIGFVLATAGILIHDNKKYMVQPTEGTDRLAVSVRPDFIAGGKPDWENARKMVSEELLFKLMPNLGRIAESLVNTFSAKYPNGMKELIFEIKSLNSTVFWSKKDYLQQAYPHHIMQLYAGMKATGLDEGHMFYISKDDLTTVEFPIFLDTPKLDEAFYNDIDTMTKYIRGGIEPPKPDNIVFDERKTLRFQYLKESRKIKGCYTENWQIGWSMYISKVTGIHGKAQKEVSARWKKSIAEELKAKNDMLKEEFKVKIDGGKFDEQHKKELERIKEKPRNEI